MVIVGSMVIVFHAGSGVIASGQGGLTMTQRRIFLQRIAALPGLGVLMRGGAAAATTPKTPDYYRDLGVRTFINAAGTYTALSASLMRPEVVDAIAVASKQFV